MWDGCSRRHILLPGHRTRRPPTAWGHHPSLEPAFSAHSISPRCCVPPPFTRTVCVCWSVTHAPTFPRRMHPLRCSAFGLSLGCFGPRFLRLHARVLPPGPKPWEHGPAGCTQSVVRGPAHPPALGPPAGRGYRDPVLAPGHGAQCIGRSRRPRGRGAPCAFAHSNNHTRSKQAFNKRLARPHSPRHHAVDAGRARTSRCSVAHAAISTCSEEPCLACALPRPPPGLGQKNLWSRTPTSAEPAWCGPGVVAVWFTCFVASAAVVLPCGMI